MIRRLKKDVLHQLPPKKRQNVEIECDKKIIKQIKAILGKKNIDEINLEENEDELNAIYVFILTLNFEGRI